MVITNEELKKIYCGVYSFEEVEDGYLRVDGFKLVPHLSESFLDNLHPNCLGTEVYGRNLVEGIRRINF